MHVLVTGAGLLGCHVAAELVGNGVDVALVDVQPDIAYTTLVAGDVPVHVLDVGHGDRLTALARRLRVDAIVHTAALLGGKANRDPYLTLRVNVGGTIAAAEAARRAACGRLVLASSLAVYDWSAPTEPLDESAPLRPRTVYGASKVAAEAVVRAYAARGECDPVVLRFAGLYGFGCFRGGSVFGALLQQTVTTLLERGRATVDARLGNREFLYARDAAVAVQRALERPSAVGIFNIGSGRVEQHADVACGLRKVIPDATVRVAATPPSTPVPALSLARARDHLGYEPSWSLTGGISEMVALLRETSRSGAFLQVRV